MHQLMWIDAAWTYTDRGTYHTDLPEREHAAGIDRTPASTAKSKPPSLSLKRAHYLRQLMSVLRDLLIFFCSCSSPYSSASAVGGHPGT